MVQRLLKILGAVMFPKYQTNRNKSFFFYDTHSIVAWITQSPIFGLFYLISFVVSSGEMGLKSCWNRTCLACGWVTWLFHLRLLSHNFLSMSLSSLSLSVIHWATPQWAAGCCDHGQLQCSFQEPSASWVIIWVFKVRSNPRYTSDTNGRADLVS